MRGYYARNGRKRNKAQVSDYNRRYRQKNGGQLKLAMKEYRKNNKEKIMVYQERTKEQKAAYARTYYRANREKILALNGKNRRKARSAGKHWGLDGYLKKQYGITADDYHRMHESQDGVCAICLQPETAIVRRNAARLAVDHCHATGRIRALLCRRCNQMIGSAEDSAELMSRAACYLRRHAAVEKG